MFELRDRLHELMNRVRKEERFDMGLLKRNTEITRDAIDNLENSISAEEFDSRCDDIEYKLSQLEHESAMLQLELNEMLHDIKKEETRQKLDK